MVDAQGRQGAIPRVLSACLYLDDDATLFCYYRASNGLGDSMQLWH